MTPGRRILFVINPHAGRSEIRGRLLEVLQIFAAAGFTTEVRPTVRAGEIPDILQSRYGHYDIVVTCGGDGTLNETINGLMPPAAAAAARVTRSRVGQRLCRQPGHFARYG